MTPTQQDKTPEPANRVQDTDELRRLLERVGAATGADRVLDAAIAQAFGWKLTRSRIYWIAPEDWSPRAPIDGLPTFTASLDASLGLLAPGWRIAEMKDGLRDPYTDSEYCHLRLWCPVNSALGYRYLGKARTPALAVCASALKALIAQAEGRG